MISTRNFSKSDLIKHKLISYLRFERGYKHIATECGHFNADVLSSDGNYLYEIEVKTSLQDFLKDFSKDKHIKYANPDVEKEVNFYSYFKYNRKAHLHYDEEHESIPNYFYFAITTELEDKVIENLKHSKYKKYGVMIVEDNLIRVMKKALKLHDAYVSVPTLLEISRRCSVQLADILSTMEIRKELLTKETNWGEL